MTIDPEIAGFLDETARIALLLDQDRIAAIIEILAELKTGQGRLFCLGVGGGAANASHAASDFRKLAGIEAYATSDNVAELTARTNDEGWPEGYAGWLAASRLRADDVVMVFSVGGGSEQPAISPNLVRALDHAKQVGAKIVGVVGRDGGHTARVADACVIIPTVNSARVTPHTEGCQGVLLHLLVSHSRLRMSHGKWESV